MAGCEKQMTLAGVEAFEVRAALEAERAARTALERRVAETVHDLRAALASVAGYAQMLVDGAEPGHLSREQVARRIATLSRNLSEMTAAMTSTSGASAHPRRRFSVRALIRACAEAIEPQCRDRGLVLRLELPVEGWIYGDVPSIRRIVLNLLSNAVRYTPRGEVRLRAELGGGHLRIDVRDTGIGIAPADIGRIFDELCRLDDARRLEPLGTGLGLATAKRLAELGGGTIRVESRPGEGSTFSLVLPVRRRRQMHQQHTLFA